jgi:hypothetical protein
MLGGILGEKWNRILGGDIYNKTPQSGEIPWSMDRRWTESNYESQKVSLIRVTHVCKQTSITKYIDPE